jgi:transposase-like protein
VTYETTYETHGKQCAELYSAGKSIRQIADQLRINTRTASGYLKKSGIELRKHEPKCKASTVPMYQQGMAIHEIAQTHDLKLKAIHKELSEAGLITEKLSALKSMYEFGLIKGHEARNHVIRSGQSTADADWYAVYCSIPAHRRATQMPHSTEQSPECIRREFLLGYIQSASCQSLKRNS